MSISILRYSQIADPAEQGVYLRYRTVYPRNFSTQMRRLKRLGFTGLSLRDLEPYLRGKKSGKVFGITFDNGFRGVHAHALATLQELEFTATSYFVPSQIGGFNSWDLPVGAPYSRCMSKAEMREWALMGHEVGAHSLEHIRLTKTSVTEARRQITLARHELEDMLGNSVNSFSYPYGDVSEQVRAIVEQAGYISATTTVSGRILPEDDMLWLPRQTIRQVDSWLNVLCKCAVG
ncbi:MULTISPECIES: polysaccharide deacetylase family protein [Rhizobium]|uniref:Chitooligosaccharide deacetylase n=1 Tax=Rhizobium tropici TaxID=398 RepID=A0A6P1CH01_RHITR|nr:MULTISPECIES: polysaccharide deacetylase family protein [Rhizobium]AGB74002.1 polysaccharide deacetylase family protein [Rhizobium tropici CIAT 899]MBB4240488.1 peptidoglycan/xylan/chitin deacetylase (PgdA/CDA1 family) [Rhizobium tropici]MBB5592096.1 peptidoglycan/xylan/chitin deacetylase (PgdA/CDA1 family) [Rhizobium tropici]MBB6491151.1 peptidoglycan/xylan/chitin deacetylase (PgdA/CDA1 family) [Rhizobium tropici]NEV15053.1 polysaccharide deacetylase family protein [Rhizobium tropici]